MEIPGSENIRIKSRAVQDKASVKQGNKAGSSTGSESANRGQSTTTEQIALSSKGRDIQSAAEIVRTTPEVRLEKVQRIKKEIAEGRFHVDSKDLAESILKSVIKDSQSLQR